MNICETKQFLSYEHYKGVFDCTLLFKCMWNANLWFTRSLIRLIIIIYNKLM